MCPEQKRYNNNTIIRNDLVKAPYKNMGNYEAVLVKSHDEKLILDKLKQKMIVDEKKKYVLYVRIFDN